MVVGMAEAGQRHDEPLNEEDRRTPSPGHFGRNRPRGDHPLQMRWWLWWTGRHQGRLDVFWRMWQCDWIVWHVWQPAWALEGPTFCLLDADDAQKGPTSPSEGPDVSLFSSYFDILAFKVTNNGILLSQPCRLFLMTYFVIKGHLDDINWGRWASF